MTDYLVTVSGKALSALVQMAMLFVLAARLAPEQLATLLAVYALASVLAALGDLGLGTLAARERAYGDPHKADRAIRAADRLALSASTIGVLALFAGSLLHPPLLACVPLLIWAPIERATENRMLRLVADGRTTRAAGLTAGRRLLGGAMFVPLLLLLPADLAFACALALPALCAQLLAVRWVPLRVSLGAIRQGRLMREALPFTLTSLSGQMRNLDVPIISWVLTGVPAAAYGFGSRLASPAMLVFSAVSNLVLVRVGRFSTRKFRILIAVVPAGAALIAVLLNLLSAPLSGLLTPFIPWLDDEAAAVMALVASSYVFAGAGIVLGSVCVALRLQRRLVQVNLVTVLSSLTAVALLALTTGSAIAAAAAALACYVAQTAALTGSVIRARSIPTEENHV